MMQAQRGLEFGVITGVFMPTILTILGAVLYLRLGWLVGNAGLVGALGVIALSMLISASTALSVASIATNVRVRAGGPFSLISQSLGLEVGGAVGLPFYLAQTVSIAFYVLAFAEGWLYVFPAHPEILVLLGTWLFAFATTWTSINVVTRAQWVILGVQALALLSIFLGSFEIGGHQGFQYHPVLIGEFEDGNFWQLMAIFFPAVTGVLSGVAFATRLKKPRHSIPRGIVAALAFATLVYVGIAYWFSRMDTPEQLRADFLVIVDNAIFGPVVVTGLLAATFAAALMTMVTAPRLLASIAEQGVIPGFAWLADTATDHASPRNAELLTGAITLAMLLVGYFSEGLNSIAPLLTMFFLTTYAAVNGVMLLEQALNLVSFRPLFRLPNEVPLLGLSGCLFAMFLINPVFSLVAITVIVGFYAYLSRRHLMNPWGDVRSGLFVTLAEWAAKRVTVMPGSQERAWKPSLLVPIKSTEELLGAYRFLEAITYPRGSVHVLALHRPQCKHLVREAQEVVTAFLVDNIFSRVAFLQTDDFDEGLQLSIDVMHSAFFKPNALFLSITEATQEDTVNLILERGKGNETGAILYAQHPEAGLGREQVINVWIRDQSPAWEVGMRLSRLDLSLLVAYQVTRNWGGRMNLITVVEDSDEYHHGVDFLQRLIELGRLPSNTRPIVKVGHFVEQMRSMPRADLHIFGIGERVSLPHIRRMVNETHASCIFVLDSGHESALA